MKMTNILTLMGRVSRICVLQLLVIGTAVTNMRHAISFTEGGWHICVTGVIVALDVH